MVYVKTMYKVPCVITAVPATPAFVQHDGQQLRELLEQQQQQQQQQQKGQQKGQQQETNGNS